MSGRKTTEPSADHPIAVQVAEGLATATAPPGHPMAGRLIAASRSAVIVAEADLPRVTYFPRENVDASTLEPTARTSWCPYKGQAAYDAVLGVPDRAWTYYHPAPAVGDIAGHVAFYPDAASVGQEALPSPAPEAVAVLDFWFREVRPGQRFRQDDAVDAEIARRFGGLHARAAAGDLDDWSREPDGAMARIILLDQFSRNLHRGAPQAFAQDEAARAGADGMVARGFDLALAPERRAFCYLPFMHAEDMAAQNRAVRLYRDRLPGADNLRYALSHREEIHRHGRFRGRDAALGRGRDAASA